MKKDTKITINEFPVIEKPFLSNIENSDLLSERMQDYDDEQLNLTLFWAAGQGNLETMKMVRGRGAFDLEGAFNWACYYGQIKAAGLLRRWGARNYDSGMCFAASTGRTEMMKFIYSWADDDVNLHVALHATKHTQARIMIKNWINRKIDPLSDFFDKNVCAYYTEGFDDPFVGTYKQIRQYITRDLCFDIVNEIQVGLNLIKLIVSDDIIFKNNGTDNVFDVTLVPVEIL